MTCTVNRASYCGIASLDKSRFLILLQSFIFIFWSIHNVTKAASFRVVSSIHKQG